MHKAHTDLNDRAIDVGEAYETLSDAQKREMYDSGVDLQDDDMFGGGGGMGGMGGMGGGGRTYSYATNNFHQFGNPESIFEKFARMEGGIDFDILGGLGSGSPLGGSRPSSFPGTRFGGAPREPNGRSKTPESTVSERRVGLTLEEYVDLLYSFGGLHFAKFADTAFVQAFPRHRKEIPCKEEDL